MTYRVAICLMLATASIAALAEPQWQEVAAVRASAITFVRTSAAPSDAIDAQLDDRLMLPRCDAELQAFRAAAFGANAQTVGVRCAAPAWTIYVPVRVTAVRDVLVAARPMTRGDTLTANDVRRERREVSGLSSGYVTDDAALMGRPLTHPVAAGAVLTGADVSLPAAVRRGQQVILVGHAQGIEVRAQGKALADAGLDQRVSVEAASSKRIIEGTVRSADTVEVGL
jgi:flagella basal body P-ring formation protein FlgA